MDLDLDAARERRCGWVVEEGGAPAARQEIGRRGFGRGEEDGDGWRGEGGGADAECCAAVGAGLWRVVFGEVGGEGFGY